MMAVASGQSITSVKLTGITPLGDNHFNVTYEADLINPGPPLASATATASSIDRSLCRVLPNLDVLRFGPMPANSIGHSQNNITIRFEMNTQLGPAELIQWDIHTTKETLHVDAGSDQNVVIGSTVTLNGSNSRAAGAALSYRWHIVSFPGIEKPILWWYDSPFPYFVANVVGQYVIELSASNGDATATASVTITASAPLQLSPDPLDTSPGTTLTLNIELPGPVSGKARLVTLTSRNSDIAMVPGTVLVPAGATRIGVPVISNAIGVTTIGVASQGFSPGLVSVTARPPAGSSTTMSFTAGNYGQPLTLNLSPPVLGTLILSVISSDPAVATVPGTVTVAAGARSITIPVTPVSAGTLKVTASAPTIPDAAIALSFTSRIDAIVVPNASIGQDLQKPIAISLPTPAPAGGILVTVTSGDVGRLLVSNSATIRGSAQTTARVAGGQTSADLIYLQSLGGAGGTRLTATAPGYAEGSNLIEHSQSAFVLVGPNGVESPGFLVLPGGSVPLTVYAAVVSPDRSTLIEVQQVRGGITGTVNLTVSDAAIGTIANPSLTFDGGSDLAVTSFHAGSTTGSATLATNATGGSPLKAVVGSLPMETTSVTVGRDLETPARVTLYTPVPIGGLPVAVTSHDPSKVLLSATPDGPGAASIVVLASGGSSFSPDFYIYGLSDHGVVSYSVTAPGFLDTLGTVTLAPSGFTLYGPFMEPFNFAGLPRLVSWTTSASAFLLDQSLNIVSAQAVRGGTSVPVTIKNSNPSVGVLVDSTLKILGGAQRGGTVFVPLGLGTTELNAVTPAGFSTPNAPTKVTVNTNDLGSKFLHPAPGPPGVFAAPNVPASTTVYLSWPAPPNGLLLTVTSGDPNIATLCTTADGSCSGTITLALPFGSQSATFYVRGLVSGGLVQYNATAPGYQSLSLPAFIL